MPDSGGQAGGIVALLIGGTVSIAVAIIGRFGRHKEDPPPPPPQPVTATFIGQLDAVSKQVDGHERRLGRHDEALTRLDDRLDRHEERHHE